MTSIVNGIVLAWTIFYLSPVEAQSWLLHNSMEYFVSTTKENFEGALSSCEKMDSQLVIIASEDIQTFLRTNLFSKQTNAKETRT